MDLTQLEIFRAVAQSGSITAAAGLMHRVPSNLTTRIKQLEAELGTELFIREKLRLRLSATGRSFLDYAERILALVDEARQVASGAEPHGSFSLGSLESTAAVRIPALLALYHQRYPKVQLDLSTGPSGEMIDGVLSGRFSAAFSDGPANHPQLEGRPVFQEELVLMSTVAHVPVRDARDVAGETVFAFRDTCSYRRRMENWFADQRVVPGKIIEMESYHGMLACIAAGGGVAMIPRKMFETLAGGANVAIHTLEPEHANVTTWLFWRRGTEMPALRALNELLDERYGATA
ncbi:putrescine utilization regulator PtrR [Pseudomonas jinjuensis]|uniref:DNA-binding transcriptional regulator, LysR family n=1 Tax=Pseudomonas jinjuensis TaxID=198616 RepID=A0A1G9ZD72_9PSED|nr:LysR family transcriptional regulator [Pseudomonas jinjuensis]SDN19279.1 DNA-binding transcriptional regulator, LysR family [Pseudomonas jinjuensis]